MACASASELDRRVATGLANASLLPELRSLRTSKPLLEHLPQLGSNGPRFACTGALTRHSSLHKTLRPTERELSACFRRRGESETTCSNRSGARPPRKSRPSRTRRRPIPRHATAGPLTSALVRAASRVLCAYARIALHVLDAFRPSLAKNVKAECLAEEVLCLSLPVLPRSGRPHEFAPAP